MNDKFVCTIWVCQDCMFVHANGETGNESPDREPWEYLFDREPDGSSVTMGLTREEHECGWQDDEDSECWQECECADTEFSWSQCQGCGSTLGGSRHAFSLWNPINN